MPNRIIKESICTSDSIDSLGLFEEVLFYRLIVVCDDYGRFDGRIPIIRGRCFPLKDLRNDDIKKALQILSEVGMVEMYEVDGKPYLQLTSWERHQQIRAHKGKYPAPDVRCNQLISDDIRCTRNPIQSESNPNRKTPPISPAESLEDFLAAYPCPGNRHLTEVAYIDCLMTNQVTEQQLVECARNYAEQCRILETQKQYIKKPENFLRDMEYIQYLPGSYVRPEKPKDKKKGKGFGDFKQNEYDFEGLEGELLAN